ncbi:MAG: ATP-binding protein, partial [Chloroflexota bacterium]|nr:ATP-binding protein [Chloroflexota bacterium]
MFGRDRERDVLSQHLTRTLAGRGSVVLVGGEAGIGKTTLIESVANAARLHGALVLRGHCYDLT